MKANKEKRVKNKILQMKSSRNKNSPRVSSRYRYSTEVGRVVTFSLMLSHSLAQQQQKLKKNCNFQSSTVRHGMHDFLSLFFFSSRTFVALTSSWRI